MGLLGLGMGSVVFRIIRRCRDPRLRQGLKTFVVLKSTRAAEIAAAELKAEQEAAAKAKADADAKSKKIQAKEAEANGGKMGLLTRLYTICVAFLVRPAPPAPKPVGKRAKPDKTPTPATPKRVIKKEFAQPWLVRLLLQIDWVSPEQPFSMVLGVDILNCTADVTCPRYFFSWIGGIPAGRWHLRVRQEGEAEPTAHPHHR